MEFVRQHLARLAQRRLSSAINLREGQSLRQYLAADTGPTRPLGFIVTLFVSLYQLWSYGHGRQRCKFPRGLNCSAVIKQALRLYGVLTGAAVVYQLLLAPAIGGDSCFDCNYSEKKISGWCN